MKTIKRLPGMPFDAKHITRDIVRDSILDESGEAWSAKPKKTSGGLLWLGGGIICKVYIGRALKPGEIAKAVP